MSNFSERLIAAKEAPRPTKDVVICLDSDVSERRAELRAQLEKARANPDARLSAKSDAEEIQEQLDELMELTSDALVTLRFTRMSGAEWAEITARCPVRLDAAIDRQYGYNMHAVCKLAAPMSGGRLEGETVVPLIVDDKVNEWTDLFNAISGHEFGIIVDAIYELNEYAPAAHVAQLKKELATRHA